ncbi:MAG TPA: hypothetical protein VHS28_11145 [Chloroflexota bacterium]|nr:hypothetical protein [Chloroflexota bacterium]
MSERIRRLRHGLVAIAMAIVAGCASSTPSFPLAETPAPPPEATPRPVPSSTAAPAAAATATIPAATGQAMPIPTVVAAPSMGRFAAVEGPPEVEQTLRAAVELQRRMESPAAGLPSRDDVVWMYQRTAELMETVSLQLPQMVPGQRDQALKQMDELINGMVRVLSSYIQTTNEQGPTVAFGTPMAVQGTPLVVIGTPRALTGLNHPPPADLLAHDIEQTRSRAVEKSQGKPSGDELVVLTTSLGATATTVRQLSGYLATEDLQRLTDGMAGALMALATSVAAYAP